MPLAAVLPNNATRRSCERCRLQKLRCTKSNSDAIQCDRCCRLGHSCVFSPLLQLGRPPRDGVSRRKRRSRISHVGTNPDGSANSTSASAISPLASLEAADGSLVEVGSLISIENPASLSTISDWHNFKDEVQPQGSQSSISRVPSLESCNDMDNKPIQSSFQASKRVVTRNTSKRGQELSSETVKLQLPLPAIFMGYTPSFLGFKDDLPMMDDANRFSEMAKLNISFAQQLSTVDWKAISLAGFGCLPKHNDALETMLEDLQTFLETLENLAWRPYASHGFEFTNDALAGLCASEELCALYNPERGDNSTRTTYHPEHQQSQNSNYDLPLQLTVGSVYTQMLGLLRCLFKVIFIVLDAHSKVASDPAETLDAFPGVRFNGVELTLISGIRQGLHFSQCLRAYLKRTQIAMMALSSGSAVLESIVQSEEQNDRGIMNICGQVIRFDSILEQLSDPIQTIDPSMLVTV